MWLLFPFYFISFSVFLRLLSLSFICLRRPSFFFGCLHMRAKELQFTDKNGELQLHSDPVCADLVRSFPILRAQQADLVAFKMTQIVGIGPELPTMNGCLPPMSGPEFLRRLTDRNMKVKHNFCN